MSICAEILKGFDLECDGVLFKKYYQNIILINRADLKQVVINSNSTANNITFNLQEGKTGYLFRTSENGGAINAEFSKTNRKGINYYEHKLEMPITGVDENAKTLLKQLDNADYFAAIHFKDNTIEIHGFNYGLKTDNYTYTPQGYGGALLPLISKYPEYDPPYVYISDTPVADFNALFAGLPDFINGDFNNDFNNDFDIIGA